MAETTVLSQKEIDFLEERDYISKFGLTFICRIMRFLVADKIYVDAKSPGTYPGTVKSYLIEHHSSEMETDLLDVLQKKKAGPLLILSIAKVYPEHFFVKTKQRRESLGEKPRNITVIFKAEGAVSLPQVCLC